MDKGCKAIASHNEKITNKWIGCPYNFEAHQKIIDDMNSGEIEYDKNDYVYHMCRIDRCYDWLYKNK